MRLFVSLVKVVSLYGMVKKNGTTIIQSQFSELELHRNMKPHTMKVQYVQLVGIFPTQSNKCNKNNRHSTVFKNSISCSDNLLI